MAIKKKQPQQKAQNNDPKIHFSRVQKVSQNQPDSHQSVPWAIVNFFVFNYRDTMYGTDSKQVTNDTFMAVNRITVVSDILSVNTRSAKGEPITTAEIVLSSGDFDYQALLTPGDHVQIWINDDPAEFTKVYNGITSGKAANHFTSGLKFVGRINSVRSAYQMTPDGKKSLKFMVTAKGFSELESQVYYNPYLSSASSQNQDVPGAVAQSANYKLIYSEISKAWDSYINSDDGRPKEVTGFLQFFINIFLGQGPTGRFKNAKLAEGSTVRSPNGAFRIPPALRKLLGVPDKDPTKPDSYADILHVLIGIQKYDESSMVPNNLPGYLQKIAPTGNQYRLRGNLVAIPDQFNNVTIWSLLQQNSNALMNEMYTTLRVNESGNIVPTFVARQIPFTSKRFYLDKKGRSINENKTIPATKYVNLPTWVIDPSITMLNYNIGTSDAPRFNFFQIYGQYTGISEINPAFAIRNQLLAGNFQIDTFDISKNGSKNFIGQTNANFAINGKFDKVREWIKLIVDWNANGHLKLNGSITTAGISRPICIGDNAQFDDMLFHIEEVSHSYQVNNGVKSFATQLGLTHGVRTDESYYFSRGDFRENITNPMAPGTSDSEITGADKFYTPSGNRTGRSGRKP